MSFKTNDRTKKKQNKNNKTKTKQNKTKKNRQKVKKSHIWSLALPITAAAFPLCTAIERRKTVLQWTLTNLNSVGPKGDQINESSGLVNVFQNHCAYHYIALK